MAGSLLRRFAGGQPGRGCRQRWLCGAVAHVVLSIGGAGTLLAGATPSTPEGIEALSEKLKEERLVFERARRPTGLALRIGDGRVVLQEGLLAPVENAAGRHTGFVFIGRGLVELEPPDEIEAHQLELFTGSRSLREPFEGAVFVVCYDAALAQLEGAPAAQSVTEEERERAQELYDAWTKGKEREILTLDTWRLLDALGDPRAEDTFVGRFESERLGDFVWFVIPDRTEAVAVGRWIPLELTKKQERRYRRWLRRHQRRGRFLEGWDPEDLGIWDVWLSYGSLQPAGRQGDFDARHYTLEV